MSLVLIIYAVFRPTHNIPINAFADKTPKKSFVPFLFSQSGAYYGGFEPGTRLWTPPVTKVQ